MASKFTMEGVSDALERSLRNAKDLRSVNAATVAAARLLAKRLDYLADNDFITESGKFDNVTVPTFLKYLQSLGLTVEAVESKAKPTGRVVEKPVDMLSAFRKRHEASSG